MRLSLLFLLLAVSWGAQEASPVPASSLPGLHVTLTSTSGAIVFPIGARIQLHLNFWSTVPGLYHGDFYDPGRESDSRPAMEPAGGWHDPFATYPGQGFIALDRLGSSGPLTPFPQVETIELNQWIRFDRPGKYSISIPTHSVDLAGPKFRPLYVLSDPIRLTITVPPPGWRQARLSDMKMQLRSSDYSAHAAAAQGLACLGGDEAARALASLCDRDNFGCFELIAQTESPAAAVPVVEAMVVNPSQPVSSGLLRTLAFLREYAVSGPNPDWQAYEAAALAELVQALPLKSGPASTASLITALDFNPSAMPASLRPGLTEQLADRWDELSFEQRNQIEYAMGGAQDPLGGPAELGLMRRAAAEPVASGFSASARSALLHRWYELAPVEARPIILNAIARADDGAGNMGLAFLPDKVLPEMNGPLLDLLDAPENNPRSQHAAELIERYASPAIAGAVSLFLGQHMDDRDCARRLPLLGYLLRVQPALATPYLAQTLRPHPEGCGADSLASRLKRQN